MSRTTYEERVTEQTTADSVNNDNGVSRREQVRVVRDASGEHREQIVENVGAERRIKLAKAAQFIWLATGLVEAMIGLRIILKLIAANPNTPFAQLTYNFTDLFLWPFAGLTVTPTAANGITLELSSFIALVVYAVATWALVKVLYLIFTPSASRSISIYDQYRS